MRRSVGSCQEGSFEFDLGYKTKPPMLPSKEIQRMVLVVKYHLYIYKS